ncbi:MAG TPA: DUF3631 domain-containing protein, partial [Rhodocyclaceae bacterium]|nr:DUF3631 domain-containing protein [Rhodocyclaceae bacterium]
KSWATYNRGKSITPRQVAKKLKDYGIASKNLRIGYEVAKGFELEQFQEAFARYLAFPFSVSATALQASNHAALSVAGDSLRSGNNIASATPKPAPIQGCSGVAEISRETPRNNVVEVEI